MDSNYTVSGAKRFWNLTVAKTNSDNKPQKTRQCYREQHKPLKTEMRYKDCSARVNSREGTQTMIARHRATCRSGFKERAYTMTKSDSYIFSVWHYLAGKHGTREADRLIDPLQWYINTGRASTGFLNCLYLVKPYCIGRILAKGGSHDEIVKRIRKRVGLPEMAQF